MNNEEEKTIGHKVSKILCETAVSHLCKHVCCSTKFYEVASANLLFIFYSMYHDGEMSKSVHIGIHVELNFQFDILAIKFYFKRLWTQSFFPFNAALDFFFLKLHFKSV